MLYLRQSTTVNIKMGPFLDATDGVTEETALAPAVEVSKNAGTYAARNSATAVAHDAEGWYTVELDTTDTNTVGRLQVKAQDSANHLPVWHEFSVIEESIFDALFASAAAGFDANGRVDVGSWLGTAVTTSATSAKPEVDAFSVSDVQVSADRLEAWINGFRTGTIEGTPTTTVFDTDSTEATNDHFNNMVISFTGGALLGQARRITDYVGSTGTFTVQPALTEAPSVGDTFIVTPIIALALDDNGRTDVGSWLGTAVTLGNDAPDVNIASTDDIDLSDTQKASVNTEVSDVLKTDTVTLPGQAAPPATPTMQEALAWLYKVFRNKKEQTGTAWSLYDDAGSTVDAKATVSDDGTTATKEEVGTGP